MGALQTSAGTHEGSLSKCTLQISRCARACINRLRACGPKHPISPNIPFSEGGIPTGTTGPNPGSAPTGQMHLIHGCNPGIPNFRGQPPYIHHAGTPRLHHGTHMSAQWPPRSAARNRFIQTFAVKDNVQPGPCHLCGRVCSSFGG